MSIDTTIEQLAKSSAYPFSEQTFLPLLSKEDTQILHHGPKAVRARSGVHFDLIADPTR